MCGGWWGAGSGVETLACVLWGEGSNRHTFVGPGQQSHWAASGIKVRGVL